MRIKAAVSKNLLIFLKKCLTHYVTLKAFRIKPPIKLQKNTPITKEYQKIYCFYQRAMPNKDYGITTSK